MVENGKHAYVKFIIAGGVVATALCLVLLYWLIRPYNNISTTSFVTDKTVYKQGEVVTLTDEFCWDGTPFISERFFQSKVSRISNGSVEFPFGYGDSPKIIEKFGQGKCGPSTITALIPSNHPLGKWSVIYRISYQANPARTISLENQSNEFEVVAK